MNFPTNLTNREREIIPFLLSGATRAEIGEALAISAETVKAHTRNLFAKFDAVNLRDCYKLLSLYQQYFGIGGMDVKMHIKKRRPRFPSIRRQTIIVLRTIYDVCGHPRPFI